MCSNYLTINKKQLLKAGLYNINQFLNYSKTKGNLLKECYKILGIPDNSDQEEIRRAYLELVKKYHPDSLQGDVNKFQEVDKAFRTIINEKSKERWEVDVEEFVKSKQSEKEHELKHAVPQHRQYLSFDGYGSGTIFQREKQYGQVRAMQAAENVMQHRIDKVTAEENALMEKVSSKHKIKTKYGFDRLVEDLIQESMSKGEFNNLSGVGKPLKEQQITNPYVDFVTHKLNQVLIENGFSPEWITLQKEVREEIQILKDQLQLERQYLGKFPLTPEENLEWANIILKQEKFTRDLNKKINKFNLLVPMLTKQMIMVNLNRLAENVLKTGKYNDGSLVKMTINKSNDSYVNNDSSIGIFGIFDMLFKK